MRPRLTLLAAALAAALALPAGAQTRPSEEAKPRDLQRLQDDLANLDDALATLPARDARGDDLRERGDELREEVIYLKVKMRHAAADNSGGTGVTYDEVAGLRRAVADLRQDIDHLTTSNAEE